MARCGGDQIATRGGEDGGIQERLSLDGSRADHEELANGGNAVDGHEAVRWKMSDLPPLIPSKTQILQERRAGD